MSDNKNPFKIEPGSFRDRNGRVYYIDRRVYRGLSPKALDDWNALNSSAFFKKCVDKGMIIPTEQVTPPELLSENSEWAAFLEHKRISFITYPYEWSFSMLKDAALLQLKLLLFALKEGLILKDSSPFNIQWQGPNPVFIDIPSFEIYRDGEPWIGYSQFCNLFLHPLMLQAYKHVDYHPWLRGQIDGIDSVDLSNLMSMRDMLRSGVFMHVYLQSKFQKKYGASKKDVKKLIKNVGFSSKLIISNVKNLIRVVKKLDWNPGGSEWADYADNTSYESTENDVKVNFIEKIVQDRKWKLVWDLGANTGVFSMIAAKNADCVVAMDSDHLCVDKIYRRLKAEKNTNINPLVNNIADSSPCLGWRGLERKSLSKRDNPDLILSLALIHHIVIGSNIPLNEFIEWLAMHNSSLIIEFVTKNDPMVKTLLRNKEDIYADYDQSFFEQCLEKHYKVIKKETVIESMRYLYFAEPMN